MKKFSHNDLFIIGQQEHKMALYTSILTNLNSMCTVKLSTCYFSSNIINEVNQLMVDYMNIDVFFFNKLVIMIVTIFRHICNLKKKF